VAERGDSTVPTNLDFEKALMYFHAYMYGPLQGKLRLYDARGVRTAGKVLSSDWEVFASILVRDLGRKLVKGIDLSNAEVKSAENKGAYEYQYHKHTGLQRLREHPNVGHLFFDHSDNLRLVELRYVHGGKMKERFFDKWLQEFPKPYPQRYRRSVPYGWVLENGTLLMRIENGEVTHPKIAPSEITEASRGLRSEANSASAGPERPAGARKRRP